MNKRRSKLISALLGMVIIAIIGLTIWPGCAMVPTPSTRTSIANRKVRDFKFLKSNQVTRAEMIRKVGEPDAYYPDIRVACYRINQVRDHEVLLFLLVLPVRMEHSPGPNDVAFIQFDEFDRAQRFSMGGAWQNLEQTARAWAYDPTKKPKAILVP